MQSETVSKEAAAILDAIRDLTPEISARSAEIEQAGRLPKPLLDQLTAAGIFCMLTPRSHGGVEIDFITSVKVLESLAAADGATGWTVMIGFETPILLALLPRQRYDALFASNPNLICAGGFAPRGEARVSGGGYRVSGRWAFASGCQHAQWLFGNCVVTENGKPRAGKFPSMPEIRGALFAPSNVKIIDSWNVSGLRGTGSHDIAVEDVAVAEDDTMDIFFGRSSIPGPLYKSPLLYFVLHIAAVGVGIARRALDEVIALALTSKRRLYASLAMSESQLFQYKLGHAESSLRAAHSLLMDESRAVWQAALEDRTPSPADRTRVIGSATWIAHSAASVVDACYTAGGGSSIYDSSALQRCLRDIHTLTQHAAVADAMLSRAGAALLGQVSESPV